MRLFFVLEEKVEVILESLLLELDLVFVRRISSSSVDFLGPGLINSTLCKYLASALFVKKQREYWHALWLYPLDDPDPSARLRHALDRDIL